MGLSPDGPCRASCQLRAELGKHADGAIYVYQLLLNLVRIKSAPSDLGKTLRALADQADRGELTDFVGTYVANDGYSFVHASSLSQELTMATMLWQRCIDRLRR
jgi:hypothetical protein